MGQDRRSFKAGPVLTLPPLYPSGTGIAYKIPFGAVREVLTATRMRELEGIGREPSAFFSKSLVWNLLEEIEWRK